MIPVSRLRIYGNAVRHPAVLEILRTVLGIEKFVAYHGLPPFLDGDERLTRVLEVLRELGVKNRDELEPFQNPDAEGSYALVRVHTFSPQEYESAPYLWLFDMPVECQVWNAIGPTPTPDPVITVRSMTAGLKLSAEYIGRYYVLAGFRRTFDEANFVGVEYRPVTLSDCFEEPDAQTGATKTVERIVETPIGKELWRLTPRIELPSMHAAEMERHTGVPWIKAGTQGPGQFRNPGFHDAQLTYTRRAIDSVGPFDVASTWEYVLPGRPNDRCLVVSQRFYQFCKMHKIEATFIPVRIIDDEQTG